MATHAGRKLRVLVAIRQSKRKDRSESPTTQREAIHRWAEIEGHEIVAEVADVGVSASVSPFERPSLGPWLTDPHKLAEWDLIAGWKVDRLSRDMVHWYGELVPRLINELGKHAVAVTEGINTATSSAIEISLRVAIAQDELTKLRDRAAGTRAGHRRRGTWPGGIPPFPFLAVKTAEGYKLAVDHEWASAAFTVIDMLFEGANLNQCVKWLNDNKVPTAWDKHAERQGRPTKQRPWRRRTIEKSLQSPHLLGYGVHKDEVIRDEDNNPLLFGEPLLDRPTWDRVQAVLDTKTRPWTKRSGGAMLRQVAFCSECKKPMYHRVGSPGRDKRRYVCGSTALPSGTRECYARSWLADELEQLVTEHFLDTYGDIEIVTIRPIRADDPTVRLSEIEDSLEKLDNDYYLKNKFTGREDFYERLRGKLVAERDELQAKKDAGSVEYIHTGKTYRQEWSNRDSNGRGDLLRQHHVRVDVNADAGHFHLYMLHMP